MPFISWQLLQILIFVAMTSGQEVSSPLVGGWTPQDVESEEIKELANRGTAKINAESNGIYQLVTIKVLSAHSQVVAGLQYKLKILVGTTNCLKSQATAAGDGQCTYQQGSDNNGKVYVVTIWQKPWEKFEQITYSEDGKDEDNE